MNTIKCACEGFFLDKFVQPSILLELRKKSCYAAEIFKNVNRKIDSSKNLDATGFYRTLKKMEEFGTVSFEWRIRGNSRPMKFYRITETGIRCLSSWQQTLTAYRDDIDALLRQISTVL